MNFIKTVIFKYFENLIQNKIFPKNIDLFNIKLGFFFKLLILKKC